MRARCPKAEDVLTVLPATGDEDYSASGFGAGPGHDRRRILALSGSIEHWSSTQKSHINGAHPQARSPTYFFQITSSACKMMRSSMAALYKLHRPSVLLSRHHLPSLTKLFSHSRPTPTPTPTQTRTTMSGSAAFFEAVKGRRTVYTITPESTIPDEKIEAIIAEAVKHAPSSFNSQSSRVRIPHL